MEKDIGKTVFKDLVEVEKEDLRHDLSSVSILSGCDYLKSVLGIGPATAYNLMVLHKTIDVVRNPAKHPFVKCVHKLVCMFHVFLND